MDLPIQIERRLESFSDPLPEGGRELATADRDTFTRMFQRFYVPLVRYAHRFTGDDGRAKDVVQDVFAKLWRDRASITINVSLKAFLYTMVRNRALNLNRRTSRVVSGVEMQVLLDRRRVQPSEEEALAAKELKRHLQTWIEELAPRRKEAFILSRYHAMTHQEIAEVMQVSKRTVDTHILLALRELRQRLDALQG